MIICIGVLIALAVVTFIMGSVPFGVVISQMFYGKDIRSEGSGNIGTTNAMRTLGKKGGVAVFVLDFGKGLLSGLVAFIFALFLTSENYATGEPYITPLLVALGNDKLDALTLSTLDAQFTLALTMGIAFFCCVMGHIFSPWLHFKGGKGIAVAVGAEFFAFQVFGALIELAVFIVFVAISRRISVGSIAAAVACPFVAAYYFLYVTFVPFSFALCTIGAAIVIWAHRGNIKRLMHGEEPKIGAKKAAEGEASA